MELTLKRLLEQAVFDEVGKGKTRGYNREEVDDFLDRAVAMATKVEAKLTETMGQARAGSGAAATDTDAEIERQVSARLAAAPPPSGPSEEESAESVRRTLVLAQRTADAAIKEAREDAARLVADATDRAESLNTRTDQRLAEVDAEIESRSATSRAEVDHEIADLRREAHARLAAEIAELESAREALRTDASVLERYVEEQRSQIRSSVGELQRLLDDPAGFRLAPAPVSSASEAPIVPDAENSGSDSDAGHVATEGPGTERSAPADAPTADEAADPVVENHQTEEAPGGGPADDAPADAPQVLDIRDDDGQSAEGPGDGTAAAAAPVDAPADPPAPMAFEEVDHAAPDFDAVGDAGPPTAPMAAVDLGIANDAPADGLESAPTEGGTVDVETDDEDAFLAELRKAMADDEPLGPRDHVEHPAEDLFGDEDRKGWFGKRR